MKIEEKPNPSEYVQSKGILRMLDEPSYSWLKAKLREPGSPTPRIVGGLRLWKRKSIIAWIESFK
jgi:hypothetical protein